MRPDEPKVICLSHRSTPVRGGARARLPDASQTGGGPSNAERGASFGPVVLALVCLLALQTAPAHPVVAGDVEPALVLGQWHELVRDEARGTVVLVNGGPESDKPDSDPLELWEWRDDGWRPVRAVGPRWRNFASVAYDSKRKRLVLYGGVRPGQDLADTWEWDGERWHERTGDGPGPREAAGLAHDARRGRTVLFGGAQRGEMQRDTWEWDGERWLRTATDGPSARFPAGFTYASTQEVVLLFGGHAAGARGFTTFGDTWTWDGTRWEEVHGAGPSARDGARAVDDAEHGGVLLFGGAELGASVVLRGDTWRWDGAWTRLGVDGPPARVHPALAHEPGRKRFLMTGGSSGIGSVLPDVWAFDGERWSCLRDCP